MNDYLSQLAARNLPQAAPSLGADVILPRPSSLFETAVPPTDAIQVEEETVVAPPAPAAPSPPPPSTIRTHRPQTEVERGIGRRPQPFVNDQEPAAPDTPPLPPWLQQLWTLTQQPPAVAQPTVPTSHEGDDEPYSGPLMPEGDPLETATAVAPPPPTPGQKASKTLVEPTPPQIIERQVVETRLLERIEHKPVVSETIVERDTPSPTVFSLLPPPPAKRVTPPQHDERKVVVTETRPYASPSHPPPAAERPPEQTPAPTVHVTIGRVEVRATRPTAVPPRRPRQAPSPVMSLDDYLRQRANGESR